MGPQQSRPLTPRSMSLVLHPDMAAHVSSQPIRIPRKSMLYEFRLNIDYVSMLWARQFLFNAHDDFRMHLRLDSSPQFNRNYLVGEIDRISLAKVSSLELDAVSSRLNVSQVSFSVAFLF